MLRKYGRVGIAQKPAAPHPPPCAADTTAGRPRPRRRRSNEQPVDVTSGTACDGRLLLGHSHQAAVLVALPPGRRTTSNAAGYRRPFLESDWVGETAIQRPCRSSFPSTSYVGQAWSGLRHAHQDAAGAPVVADAGIAAAQAGLSARPPEATPRPVTPLARGGHKLRDSRRHNNFCSPLLPGSCRFWSANVRGVSQLSRGSSRSSVRRQLQGVETMETASSKVSTGRTDTSRTQPRLTLWPPFQRCLDASGSHERLGEPSSPFRRPVTTRSRSAMRRRPRRVRAPAGVGPERAAAVPSDWQPSWQPTGRHTTHPCARVQWRSTLADGTGARRRIPRDTSSHA